MLSAISHQLCCVTFRLPPPTADCPLPSALTVASFLTSPGADPLFSIKSVASLSKTFSHQLSAFGLLICQPDQPTFLLIADG
jgi:hypothetical protein